MLCVTIIGALVCVIATLVWDDRTAIKVEAEKALEQGRQNTSDIQAVKNAIINVASKQDIADLKEAQHKEIEVLLVKLMDRTSKRDIGPKYPGNEWKPE